MERRTGGEFGDAPGCVIQLSASSVQAASGWATRGLGWWTITSTRQRKRYYAVLMDHRSDERSLTRRIERKCRASSVWRGARGGQDGRGSTGIRELPRADDPHEA